jgi:hypothetical protein
MNKKSMVDPMDKLSLTVDGLQKFVSLRTHYNFLIIVLVALLVSFLKGPSPAQNHFNLADGFLHGQLGVSGGGTSLAEVSL